MQHYLVATPTLDATQEDKDSFYEQLDAELQHTPLSDKIIILGDFNARVGSSYLTWAGVIGNHGYGKIDANGHRLLSLCSKSYSCHQQSIYDERYTQGNMDAPKV